MKKIKKFNKFWLSMFAIILVFGLGGIIAVRALAPGAVDLGSANDFAVLAGAAISDIVVPSTITGDVGLSPTGGTAITGLSCTDVTGTIYDTNGGYTGGYDSNVGCLTTNAGLLTTAKADVSSAYNDAETAPLPTAVTASTTDSFASFGYVLTPGVYNSGSSMGVPIALELDGGGDPDAVFIFQAGSTLNTTAGSIVTLSNGAQACNVFWQVGSSTTFGSGSTFSGTVMSAVSITDTGDSTIDGRLLADADDTDADSTGAVTLNNTTVTVPSCAPSLTLDKVVVNDDGGTSVESDWTITATGPVVLSGAGAAGSADVVSDETLLPGTYVLSETGPAGYDATYSCVLNGGAPVVGASIDLVAGDVATCTITNDDIAPQLVVTKIVVGGSKVISDFSLFLDGVGVTSGAVNNPTVGLHTVSETPDSTYTTVIGGDCAADGTITVAVDTVYACTVTNTYITPPSSGGGGGGGYYLPVPPLIDVVKVPTPLALPNGPGLVQYTYTLRNIGTVPVSNITMVGDTCSPIVLVSGDTNLDSRLDLNEVWVHTCSTTLQATHTNTVTATGWANGISAVDIASATVIVGAGIVPPLIHITKIPSPLALFSGSGIVTYTNKVTNPGTVPLSNVIITDDKCSPVNYISGDLNGNAKLDVSETWTYSCNVNLTQTTTNTASASGEANGLIARDFAIATVVVSTPGLPKTGLPPKENNKLGIIIIVSSIIGLSSLFYIIRKNKILQ